MIKFAIVSRDFTQYERLLSRQTLSAAECIFAGLEPTPEVLRNAEVILSEPDLASAFIEKCQALKWLQSTWAGNNKLQENAKRDYLLTGCKGIFAAQMREYALAYMLHHQRRIQDFAAAQKNCQWTQYKVDTLAGKTLGIMGMGSIGVELAKAASAFEMNLIAITHSRKPLENVMYYSLEEKLAFAKHCDYLLNLLPETEATKGVIDEAFLYALPNTCLLINAGRGSVIESEEVLYEALVNNQIAGAVLDVFTQEPLPKTSLLYQAPRCTITNHTAANSFPEKVFDVFLNNLSRYVDSQPLLYQHNFKSGY